MPQFPEEDIVFHGFQDTGLGNRNKVFLLRLLAQILLQLVHHFSQGLFFTELGLKFDDCVAYPHRAFRKCSAMSFTLYKNPC